MLAKIRLPLIAFSVAAVATTSTSITGASANERAIPEMVANMENLCSPENPLRSPAEEEERFDMAGLCTAYSLGKFLCVPNTDHMMALDRERGNPVADQTLQTLLPGRFEEGNPIAAAKFLITYTFSGNALSPDDRQRRNDFWNNLVSNNMPATDDLIDATANLVAAMHQPDFAATCGQPLARPTEKPLVTPDKPKRNVPTGRIMTADIAAK